MRGTLSLGTGQCTGVVDAAPLLRGYRSRHPELALHLQQAGTGQLLDLLRGEHLVHGSDS